MKEAMPKIGSIVRVRREGVGRARERARCSICTRRLWFKPIRFVEAEGVPEPRLSWTLCKPCYQALLTEMHRSPVRSLLRARVAMGIVASERLPQAHSPKITSYISDRRWIFFMSAGFILAMLVHLALIVIVGGMK